VGDFDGDGRLELIAPGDYPEKGHSLARCFDGATGDIRWSLPIESPPPIGSAVSADLDGDGRDECLFTAGGELFCIGANARGDAGEIRWTMRCPAEPGPLSLADALGNGALTIILPCTDGFVYGIGQ
jgi:hypothetical protein